MLTCRPGYILATNSGMYNGMLKHNLLKSVTNNLRMSSLNFVELFRRFASFSVLASRTRPVWPDLFTTLSATLNIYCSSTLMVRLKTRP